MAVYVDELRKQDASARFPYSTTCHMIADTSEELRSFAEKIGMKPHWLQAEGTPEEHFDLTKGTRAKAVAAGAKTVTARELVAIIKKKRNGS